MNIKKIYSASTLAAISGVLVLFSTLMHWFRYRGPSPDAPMLATEASDLSLFGAGEKVDPSISISLLGIVLLSAIILLFILYFSTNRKSQFRHRRNLLWLNLGPILILVVAGMVYFLYGLTKVGGDYGSVRTDSMIVYLFIGLSFLASSLFALYLQIGAYRMKGYDLSDPSRLPLKKNALTFGAVAVLLPLAGPFYIQVFTNLTLEIFGPIFPITASAVNLIGFLFILKNRSFRENMEDAAID